MALADLLTVRLRLRPDLVICPQKSGRRRSWVVKDPIALRYFTFAVEEFSILEALDGTRRLDDLRERFERLFAPRRMTADELTRFLGSLYANGLLVADRPEQAAVLLERSTEQRRRERRQAWTNLLAIRFRGIDPERVLDWLYGKLRWCFSPLVLSACLVAIWAAAGLFLVEAQEFRAQLPSLAEFVSARNVMWVAVVLAVTKVLHELGHAVVCKHFRGECHEMGVMLLLFTPCLYCNVTDAWILSSRWRRIAISAAGIGIEMFLAALAVFGWWLTQPGLLHTIFVNTILVCGIGTLVFNGNPLLRYDGYFVLSDLLNVPNLWQESRSLIRRRVNNWFVRTGESALPVVDERAGLLISYGIASMAYRAFVLVAVMLFIYRCLAARGLEMIAYMLMASMLAGFVFATAPLVHRTVASPWFWRRARRGRLAVSLLLLAAATLLFLFLPLPCRLHAPVLADVKDAERIYVTSPGTLTFSAAAGANVQAGEPIARLEDADMNRKLVELAGEHERLLARVKHLEVRATFDADAAAGFVVAKQMRADAADRLSQQQREHRARTLTAPIAGTVIPPPPWIPPDSAETGKLPAWSGTPLEPRNSGCYLPRGTLFCTIGDPGRVEAVAYVDEADVQYARVGQPVRIAFDVGSRLVVSGRVVEVAEADVEFVPAELAAGKELANEVDAAGNRRALETAYQIRIELADAPAEVISGARGRAKIRVEPQTLALRLYRAVRRILAVARP